MTTFRPDRLSLPLTCANGHSWFCLFDFDAGKLFPVNKENLWCPTCQLLDRDAAWERKPEIPIEVDTDNAARCRRIGEGK